MPNLNDIVVIADALEKDAIDVVQDRCVVVRNRNARCRKCVDVCPQGALSVEGNEVLLDSHACRACGSCAVVCPTEALVPLQPSDSWLHEHAEAACEAADNRVVFACARMASKCKGDPEKFTEVPCLSRIHEGVMVKLLAEGADQIMLVDGGCSTCKYRASNDFIEETVAYANKLVPQGHAPVARLSEFPSDMLLGSEMGAFGSTRRGFFSDAAVAAKETAMTAARASIDDRFGAKEDALEIGQRLRVGENGKMPQFSMPRHEDAINALYELGAAETDSVTSRLFGSISFDLTRCNACGMCAMFCPTGALSCGILEDARDSPTELEFSASDCVSCGSCVDVCWKDCIALENTVRSSELFDFEPRVFRFPQVAPRTSRFF